MSAVGNLGIRLSTDTNASTTDINTTGTGFLPFESTDFTGTGATLPVELNLTTTTWDPVDKEAFLTEWRKLRKELLPLLLKDDHWPIQNMKVTRRMDPKSKTTIVQLELEYKPNTDPKTKIRTAL